MSRRPPPAAAPPDDPSWYKDAIVYEVHVRTFRDSDGDGVGDFRGLTDKLDHIVELGVTAVWVLPFYPSPGRDGGYDIADYRGVNPRYGTLRDFRRFVEEAHRRGLRVITELVCNHTSDQHPWFQAARRARPGSRTRARYVWSDTPERYADARIIFTDTEPSNWSWDEVAGAWYWHRFFHHQPDLNFEEPSVHRELFDVVDFWLGMGVDGLRLDAIPYLYEREGTNCENLPETHAFLRALRAHVDERFPGRLLVAEANQWPERAVAYFGGGRGDECHMCFHFPIMPRLYMALRREDRHAVVDILEQTPPIPETSQWAMFLRNHDELTLEMVTDEERDFMYRVYAEDPQMRLNLGIRRRLAPLMGGDRRRLELMHGLLFSLPGTPFLYYGDEIGMGDNVYLGDRDGVRTPMQWSGDRNAGFSEAETARLTLPLVSEPAYHYLTVNVAAQRTDPDSWLSWVRRLIDLRKRYPVFGRGTLEMLEPDNPRVLAFLRRGVGQEVLVIANLSRFAQPVRLELPAHTGWRPVELFGQTPFPAIGDDGAWSLSLAPHAFLWFGLEEPATAATAGPAAGSAGTVSAATGPAPAPPSGTVPESWPDEPDARLSRDLTRALAAWLPLQPWFRGALRGRDPLTLEDLVPLADGSPVALVLVRAAMADGEETFLQPLAIAALDGAVPPPPETVIVAGRDGARAIVDASTSPELARALVHGLGRRRGIKGWLGQLAAEPREGMRETVALAADGSAAPAGTGTRNVSLTLGRAYLKLYRRVEPGPHVELEVGRQLRSLAPALARPLTVALTWRRASAPLVVGGLGAALPGQGDGWGLAVEAVAESLERMAGGIPAGVPERAVVGDWLEVAARFGTRIADLQGTLAAAPGPEFRPEGLGELYQRALYQAVRDRLYVAGRAADARARTDERRAEDARRLRAVRGDLDAAVRRILDHPFAGRRIRCHGDMRLEHVLYSGGELAIVDFEGDPALPMSERRIKRSPYRDVASLLASFAEAAGYGLELARGRGVVRDASAETDGWLLAWLAQVAAAVVAAHAEGLAHVQPALLPSDPADASALLRALEIDALAASMADPRAGHPSRLDMLVPRLEVLARSG